MPRLKRVSENELNKDIYDAGEDGRSAETPDPGRGMSRASADVLQKRKILKVSSRAFKKFGGGVAAPSRDLTSRQATPSNPFASTTLAPPTTTSNEVGELRSKLNPFAKTQLTTTSIATADKPTFSFTTSSASTSAPKPTTSTFSFASNADSSSLSTKYRTTEQAPRSSGGNREKIRQLNENLLETIVAHWKGGAYTQSYADFLNEYQGHKERLQLDAGADEVLDEIKGGATLLDSSVGFSSASNVGTQPAASSLSFGAPAVDSSGEAASQTSGTFSFGKKAAGPMNSTPATPAFSFNSGAPSNSNAKDPTSNPDDGKLEKVKKEENSEEETLHEFRAKHMKLENKEWKRYGVGVLRLYRHKKTSKQRMVIRNELGKVQFNVGVSKGMKFEKKIKTTKKGKAAFVKFLAIEDANKGPESFMLQVKPESVDKLHEVLEAMVA